MGVSNEGITAEQKIVLATIEAIEEEGLPSLTIRGIAARAGVNGAAINYYFRSKEKLVAEVLRQTREHAESDMADIASRKGRSFRENLRELLIYTLEGAIRYPRLLKAHLHGPLVEDRYDNPGGHYLDGLMVPTAKLLEDESPGMSADAVKMTVIRLFSAVITPALMPDLFVSFSGYRFRDRETCAGYVDNLMESVMPGKL